MSVSKRSCCGTFLSGGDPNPNRGDLLNIRLEAVPEGITSISIDMFDMNGRRVVARQLPVNSGNVNMTMDLAGTPANGMYLMNITVGERTLQERSVVHP